MDQNNSDSIILPGSSNLTTTNQLVTYKENPIRDICILTKNFDLSSMPSNYMRRRSKIEEVIYRAVFSQNNHKSPFSSFKIAKNCLEDLDKIDIVTGINNLKKVIKSTHSNNEQISIMVHKVADTWLLDEFDIDALFLRHQHYADWDWLRNFIKQECFQLAKPDFSRASISMRDLYAKFLYHSVSQPSIEMPNTEMQSISGDQSPSQLSVFKQPIRLKMESKFTSTNHRFDTKNEDFLNLVDWKLEDLSFVVGSDLSIFGTKSHPCISLRLSPCHEPINILTGMDMWLENMLNEVPEIAMCYHDQGIVMREYEILKTEDIPTLADFNQEEVKSIAKNLSHFLSTNATKEGHTYWLFKESDSTTVKLYDLTSIWEKDQKEIHRNKTQNQENLYDNNPFIIPVAILCYKMAEKRVNQWNRAREKRGKNNLTSSQFNRELLDNKLADNEYYFNEIFRLLKNCINLLMKTDKHREVVTKAMLMMCRLYLEVDQATLNNLQYQSDPVSNGITKLDLNDLKKDDIKFVQESMLIASHYKNNDLSLIGSKLYEHCANKNTQEIIEQAIQLIDICHPSDQIERIADNNLWSCQVLYDTSLNHNNSNNQISTDAIQSVGNRQITVRENLMDSVILYYMRQCSDRDLSTCNLEEIKFILKTGFMVALLDEEVLSDKVKLLREHDCYYALIASFLKFHVDFHGSDNSNSDQSSILSNVDKKILKYHYEKQEEQFINAIFVFNSVMMSEKRRLENKNNKIHEAWYQAVLYMTSLTYKLSQFTLSKPKSQLIQRAMPIFLNFLVSAIVKIYQQMSLVEERIDAKEANLKEWSRKTVVPSLKWISDWTNLQDFNSNLDENLVALVWSNKAKLCRLAGVLLSEIQYDFIALEAYTNAIDTLSKQNKKKPTPMALNIKCDRLDLCILTLEKAYNFYKTIPEMNRAVDCAEKFHRIELSLQSIPIIKSKLTSLRLRINFIRYYLNLKANRPLNYDQILGDLKNDRTLILQQTNDLAKCKEILLIQFYMFKIQSDRCELLSIGSIRQFLSENWSILIEIFKSEQYLIFFENDGKSIVTGIYENLVSILRTLVKKCKCEVVRKKKRQIDSESIDKLENFLNICIDKNSNLTSLKNLLIEAQNIL